MSSDLVRAMTSPTAFHRDAPDDARDLWPRLALSLLTLGTFVSITTAGRVVPWHLVGVAVSWSFLFALQAIALRVSLAAGRAHTPFARAYALYLAGHGPWWLLLTSVAAVCLVARDVAAVFRALLSSGALPAMLLATVLWGAVITHTLMRAVCPTRGRAALATAAFYATLVALIVGWYVATDELPPLLDLYP